MTDRTVNSYKLLKLKAIVAINSVINRAHLAANVNCAWAGGLWMLRQATRCRSAEAVDRAGWIA